MGKVNGMAPAAIEAIAKAKPYRGGNDTLWHIHKLNIIDKHRLLITAGGQYTSDNFPSLCREQSTADAFGLLAALEAEGLRLRTCDGSRSAHRCRELKEVRVGVEASDRRPLNTRREDGGETPDRDSTPASFFYL